MPKMSLTASEIDDPAHPGRPGGLSNRATPASDGGRVFLVIPASRDRADSRLAEVGATASG